MCQPSGPSSCESASLQCQQAGTTIGSILSQNGNAGYGDFGSAFQALRSPAPAAGETALRPRALAAQALALGGAGQAALGAGAGARAVAALVARPGFGKAAGGNLQLQ